MIGFDINSIDSKSQTEGDGYEISNFPLWEKLEEFESRESSESKDLNSFLKNYAESLENVESQVQMAACGVELLKFFVRRNWTGPQLPSDERINLVRFETKENLMKQLVVDGENVISVVEFPETLLISKIILEVAASVFHNLQGVKLWYLRCLFIHQQILEELSPVLFDKINSLMEQIQNELDSASEPTAISLHLEFARIHLYYQYVHKSKMELNKAMEISGINISFSGALGKRTKFQKENLAQLIIKVNVNDAEKPEESEGEGSEPKDVKLEDDVRLDKIQYEDESLTNYGHLTDIHQIIVLGNLFQTEKSQPKDSLADEELQPLIRCILEKSKVWPARMATLFLRSKMEASHKRTVERAMMQAQVLSESLKYKDPPPRDRFRHFFVSYMPAKWEIDSLLADILTSMGSVKSALEIYVRLEDWEKVIFCYNALQLRHKAQEIIEQELKKNPTPKLWCLLGDATDDVGCYETAWKLSGEKSARAQRHWAYYYYYRRDYSESIEHFQKSLERNSLQKDVWYRLGYAALMAEKWEISAAAYRRYCVLDPECFEAWNNLARCYCELRQKPRAWAALREALKVDYSNWKVWDNYMVVSSDMKAFEEVIKSYHEILNLKGKHLDVGVLRSLVAGLKEYKDGGEEGGETGKLRSKVLELFGRLTSQIVNESDVWLLYSEAVEADSPEALAKKHQLLMKAHRSAINKPGWETSLDSCNKIVYLLSKMVEVGLETKNPNILMSCKLAAGGALAKIKKLYPDAGVCETLDSNLHKLEEALNS